MGFPIDDILNRGVCGVFGDLVTVTPRDGGDTFIFANAIVQSERGDTDMGGDGPDILSLVWTLSGRAAEVPDGKVLKQYDQIMSGQKIYTIVDPVESDDTGWISVRLQSGVVNV